MVSLTSVLVLLALAPGAAIEVAPDLGEPIVGQPVKHGGKCKGYHTGPGMDQKYWKLASTPTWGDDNMGLGCQGISVPCPAIEIDGQKIKYMGNCNQEDGPPGDPAGCLPMEPWCIDLCEKDSKRWNIAMHESNDDDMGCWCGRGNAIFSFEWSDDMFDDDMWDYACPYKPFRNPNPPTNGCPAEAFDYGPDGGCGCYDDELWHMTLPDGAGEVTCADVTYEQCKLKSDDYFRIEGKEACAQACQNNKDSWTYSDNENRTCAYVAEDPVNRCNIMGNDGQLASKACKIACGCPKSKGFVTQFWGKSAEEREAITMKNFAARVMEEDNRVAVRVPTLVAVCVLAGVALGAVATMLAPTTKKVEETTPLMMEAKA